MRLAWATLALAMALSGAAHAGPCTDPLSECEASLVRVVRDQRTELALDQVELRALRLQLEARSSTTSVAMPAAAPAAPGWAWYVIPPLVVGALAFVAGALVAH